MTEPNPTAVPLRPSRAVLLLGSALGTGYAPIASGTFGSALAVAWCLIPHATHPGVLLPLTLVLLFLGARAAEKMEAYYGPDPAEVTVDEVVGQWITFLFLPVSIPLLIAGFFLFRFFDIVKPYPARVIDRRRGGWPIMLDDVVAGVYANLVLQIAVSLGIFG
jgi:phosphatidylglycerophosphatase A